MTTENSPVSMCMFTTFLPEGFSPSCNEVMIGRGRKCIQHPGTVKLHSLVQLKAKDYRDTTDKTHKSFIISEIGNRIKRESKHGGFVKKDTQSGKWFVVSDSCVRATIAQAFRDCLSPNYRSSKFSKQRRRWCQKTTTDPTPAPVTTPVVSPPAPTNTAQKCIAAPEPASCGMNLKSKPEGENCFTEPLSMLNLQRMAWQTPAGDVNANGACNPVQIAFPKPNPVRSTPAGIAKNTSNILKMCLEVLDCDDEDDLEDWISYSDNPFEPNPIAFEPNPIAEKKPLGAGTGSVNFNWQV